MKNSCLLTIFALAAVTVAAQQQYSVILITSGSQLDGSITAAGFPVTAIPFVSQELPQLDPVTLPPGWGGMQIIGICNGAEVGVVFSAEQRGGGGGTSQFSIPEHAALWRAPLWQLNDLQNSMVASAAVGCDGNVQVGTDSNEGGTAHAVMWLGSAKTQIDLYTGPYLNTGLNSVNVSSNTQVGSDTLEKLIVNGIETKRLQSHLLLWHGTTKSVVDLHPAGWLDSAGQLFGPTFEVGYADKFDANNNFFTNAFVWSGTAASAINLHQFLPASFACSQAFFMDVPTGVISGSAGDCATVTATVLWVPVH